MIDVVRAVSTTAAVQTPVLIDRTNAQLSPVGPAIGLSICNPLAGVLCDFPSAFEMSDGETALAFDRGFPDC